MLSLLSFALLCLSRSALTPPKIARFVIVTVQPVAEKSNILPIIIDIWHSSVKSANGKSGGILGALVKSATTPINDLF